MLQTHSPTKPRSAAATEIPLSLAEVRGAVRGGLVPMPAESAGYLLLGLADLLAKAPLPLQERAVLLSSEGGLSMLALSTTSRQANADEAGLEKRLRALLGQLLEYAPSQAPSLSVVARRPPQGSLSALIRELEGALIPVNRAAGKRALARLSREVERVRHRIPASPPPPAAEPVPQRQAPQAAQPARPARAAQPAQPAGPAPQRREATPARAAQIPSLLPAGVAPIPSLLPPSTLAMSPRQAHDEQDRTALTAETAERTEVQAPVAIEEIHQHRGGARAEPAQGKAAEGATAGASSLAGQARAASTLAEPAVAVSIHEPPRAASRPAEPARIEVIWTDSPPVADAIERIAAVAQSRPATARSEAAEESPGSAAATTQLPQRGATTVEQMLARWSQQDDMQEREARRWLKQSVGIEPSALPPGVETFAPPVVAASMPWQAAPEVALIMPPLPEPPAFTPRPPRRPRSSLALTTALLLLGLAVTLAIWIRAPGFFSGHLP